jgi:hypothetical protein
MNCWEFKNCGREPNGHNIALGICPASLETKVNGIHGGKNGGRCCWAVAGTLCGGEVQGSFGSKVGSCIKCDFYKITWKEEQVKGYKEPSEIINILKK